MKKIAAMAGWVLLALALILALGLLWYRNGTLPQRDGQLRLEGLQGPVDIVRDAEGIPHIYARSADDAWFALGFAHAQDRLWQMEMHRRIGAGRMAEILGPGALATDRFLRTLGVRRNAEAILPNLSPDARAVLQAYARGVNAWIASGSQRLPVEFLLTGAPAPEPWEPADSLAWQTMLAWDLGANWSQELLRMRLAQRLSLEQINQFLPPYPGDAVLPTRDYTGLYQKLAGLTQQLEAVAAAAPPSHVEGMGSNNWVLAGAATESGKPLLANDPHLGLGAPSLWYLAHLSAPGLEVIGATMAGIPGVVLGRNDRIAWGFTNTAPDVQDLYIERIHPDDPGRYQTPQGWAEFRVRRETIRVKGQPDVSLDVRETRHGPVISGALPVLEKAPLDASRYAVAFAWTALRPDDRTFQGGLRMNQARNWEEFLAAARDFHAPQQNIVYADVDGNIGFVAPGRVPVRKPENDLKGLAPAPGWDNRYDWDGFIPFEALPRQLNPAAGRIATANEKIVGPDYPYFLTSEWSLPYRAQRIASLLDARPMHTMASLAAIQGDHVSLAARELLPLALPAGARSERGRKALAMLAAWGGEMAPDRPEPLVFNAWMREASRLIFADELGQDLMEDYWSQRNTHQAMVDVLRNQDGQGAWCRNVAQPANGAAADCAGLLALALERALDDLEQRHGKEMASWRWGEAHPAVSEHRPFSKVPLLAPLFGIEVPSAGDTYTINVGRYDLRNVDRPFASRHAPGYRALYDLSDLENSRFIQSTGQSGNVMSPLYRHFSRRWAEVEYLPMQTRRASVEQGSMGTLSLHP